MKRNVTTLIMYFICLHFSFGQCNVIDTIYTPMGSAVAGWIMCETPIEWRDSLDLWCKTNYHLTDYDPNNDNYDSEYIMIVYDNVSSTSKFNCHGYAWIRAELGIDRSLGVEGHSSEMAPFMNDGSYIEAFQPVFPAKVWWSSLKGNPDHSGITTEHPGYVISKWGGQALCRHWWSNNPFTSNDVFLRYYVRNCSCSAFEKETVNFANLTMNDNLIVRSCNDIIAQNVIVPDGINLVMVARDSIILGPGFHAAAGSNVTISIGDPFASSSQFRSENFSINEKTSSENLGLQIPTRSIVNSIYSNFDCDIYPNPCDGNFSIELKNKATVESYMVEFFNSFGLLAKRIYCTDNQQSVNCSDLCGGVYFVKISIASHQVTKKLIIRK